MIAPNSQLGMVVVVILVPMVELTVAPVTTAPATMVTDRTTAAQIKLLETVRGSMADDDYDDSGLERVTVSSMQSTGTSLFTFVS